MKGALGMELLSLKRLSAEDLKGGLFYWGTWVMKGRLWGQAPLFMGAQLVSSTRDFERWLKGALEVGSLSLSLSLYGSSV